MLPLKVLLAHSEATLVFISICAVHKSLANNNISQICYCGQILLQSTAAVCSFSDNPTPLGVPFILLVMVS